MKSPRLLLTTLSIALLPARLALAATYYIDYAAGDDALAGTVPAQAWKHCPGDAAAAGNVASAKLAAGDVVIFKGGVEYPGGLSLKFSGEAGRPITFDGNSSGKFGDGRAIFSGAQHIEMKKCAAQDEAGGAKDWQHCFAADLLDAVDPLAVNLFYEGEQRGVVAREPNIENPMWWQDMNGQATVPKADITPTSLKLPAPFAAPAGQDWKGAFVGVWAIDNRLDMLKVTSVTSDGSTIGFAGGRPRKGDDNHFALFNHPRLLDRKGEYVIVNGGKRLILQGGDNATPPAVTISVRPYGINLNEKAHIVIKHLTLRNFSGPLTDQRAGSGIISWQGGGGHAEDIVVDDCESSYNQSLARAAGLQFVGVHKLVVENCRVADNQGSPGIFLGSCENAIVRKNTLVRNGGTGLRCFTTKDSVFEDNTVSEHLGMHANGISIYLDSQNIVVQRNIVTGGQIPLTLQSSKNVKVDYNVLTTEVPRSQGLALWPPLKTLYSMTDVYIRNNVIMVPGDNGFIQSDKGVKGLHVTNNIISGGGVAPGDGEASNNLYTVKSWIQQKPDWKPEPGAVDAKPEQVFVNPAKGDFHLLPNSPAADKGKSWGQKSDLEGKPIKGTPDIGAYEKQ